MCIVLYSFNVINFTLKYISFRHQKRPHYSDPNCHSTFSDQGFHVYFDEMSLDTGDMPLSHIPPKPDRVSSTILMALGPNAKFRAPKKGILAQLVARWS